MPSTRIAGLASTLAVIGLAALAPSAGAAWGTVDVSASALNPQIATDADGDSALAFEFGPNPGGRVQGRTMSPVGALVGPFELGNASDTTDRLPRVAIDAAGDSVFMWVNNSFVLGRRRSAAGTLGTFAFQISPGGSPGPFSAPDVATDFNGDTVFVWMNHSFSSGPRVQARTMTKRGVLGTIRNISAVGQIGTHPQVATDASGDSVITWVQEDGVDGDNDVVQARTMTVGGSLGPITNLSDPAGRAFSPQVASDADGDTTFVWLRFDGRRDRVQGRVMNSAGVLGAVFNLTTSGTSASDPQVAVDSVNDAVFTWERFDAAPNNTDRIQARTRIAGVLGAGILQVSPTTGVAFSPQVASDANGASMVTWLHFDGTNDRVQARPITAGGALGALAVPDLSAAGADARAPQVAMAANTGAAFAIWERNGTVQAAGGP
jgi:hypothetical protein